MVCQIMVACDTVKKLGALSISQTFPIRKSGRHRGGGEGGKQAKSRGHTTHKVKFKLLNLGKPHPVRLTLVHSLHVAFRALIYFL